MLLRSIPHLCPASLTPTHSLIPPPVLPGGVCFWLPMGVGPVLFVCRGPVLPGGGGRREGFYKKDVIATELFLWRIVPGKNAWQGRGDGRDKSLEMVTIFLQNCLDKWFQKGYNLVASKRKQKSFFMCSSPPLTPAFPSGGGCFLPLPAPAFRWAGFFVCFVSPLPHFSPPAPIRWALPGKMRETDPFWPTFAHKKGRFRFLGVIYAGKGAAKKTTAAGKNVD